MKTLGIRQAKAHLSELARNAANGECSLITDNRKPVAMIGPPPGDGHGSDNLAPAEGIEAEGISSSVAAERPMSDAAAFREALFNAPFPVELDF